MITWIDSIIRLKPCWDARDWMATPEVSALTFSQVWAACERGDWMLWLAARSGIDRKLVVLAACSCARPALVYVPAGEKRPRVTIETVERWTRGEATIEEVRIAENAAADAAHAADAVYYVAVAYYAAEAAYAAAAAATAYYAASYAAEAASYAASYPASYAAEAASYAVDANAAAQRASWKRSAELVRRIISAEMVEARLQ